MTVRSILTGLVAAGIILGAGSAVAAETQSSAKPEVVGGVAIQDGAGRDDLLIRRERYFYSSFSRRDPFASLISGNYASTDGNDLLDIGEISLVGVIWGEDDRFAMVEDQRHHVHVLRKGDRVVNGKVIKISQTSLTVQHYFFGETANVTIHLKQGEGDHETR